MVYNIYIMYMYICEQACWAHLAGNSAIENLCIIIIIIIIYQTTKRQTTVKR